MSAFSACSGGAHGPFEPPAKNAPQAIGVQFTIAVPRQSAAAGLVRPAYISQATQSAALSVDGASPVIANLTAKSANCSTQAAGLVCTIDLTVPPGSATFDEKLYDGPNGTGNVLSTGHQTATIVAGTANKVSIALSGIIVNLAVSLAAPPVQGAPSSSTLTVAAQDADKQTITGDPYAVPITVSVTSVVNASNRRRAASGSGNSALLSLNGGAPASSVTVTLPSDVVKLVYDGTQLAGSVVAAAQGVSPANAVPLQFAPKTPSTADWNRMGFDGARTSYNPSESILSAANVGTLALKWSFPLAGPYANTQPIVASNVVLADGTYADVVYVGDEHGNFYAVNAATGTQIWSKQFGSENEGCGDMPDATFGNTGAPLFDRKANRLYLLATAFPAANSAADNRFIYAFDPGSGSSAAGWPASGVLAYTNAHINNTYSGLNQSADGKHVYWDRASNCDFGPYYGGIGSIDTTAQTTADFEAVTNKANVSGNGIWSWGNPTIDPDSGALFAGVGNAFPENAPNSNSVIQLDPGSLAELSSWQSTTVSGDADFGTHPVPFDELGSKCIGLGQKSGTFYLFNRTNISAGPTQTFGGNQAIVSPAYSPANHMLYLANGTVQAFTIGMGCTVTPAWSSSGVNSAGSSIVAVAGGVVYVSGYGQVYALNAASGGAPLWTSPKLSGMVEAEPAVANGRVYAVAWDCPTGNCYNGVGAHAMLYAFGLP